MFWSNTIECDRRKLSCDIYSIEPYKEKFKKLLLIPDQVYNTDKSGLFWLLLLKKTSVYREEANAPGWKIAKDGTTFMPWSNVSDTHKLSLLDISKSKNPRTFKNINLPVDYKNQSKDWISSNICTFSWNN